ncbi:hypothetical protein P3H80_08010 [Mycolicibacterium septicum]|uniref:hypothetical protein n=1 Tax=Mycolicibacterium septicum TaxID=98668 RepID=UPI0023E2D17E|nr:hypothetical protein [Mycolicibacterium septicum]MDF3337360.1 hypothetical protein [Mycolicibacterium septicum]
MDIRSAIPGIPALARYVADPLRLRVGEVYDSGVQRWPGQELVLTTEGCVLLVDIAPTPEQIDEFHTAAAHFAWVDGRHNGILCCRFGTLPWGFFPFNPHRDTPREKTPGMPEVAPRDHLAVAAGLARGESPVLAVRVVEWPEHFVNAVGATVARLTAQPFDPEAAVNESNWLYLSVGAERLVQRAGVWSVTGAG